MTGSRPRTAAAFRRLVARIAAGPPIHRRQKSSVDPGDARLPEQRLLDAAARYGRILANEGQSRRRTDATAAGVRTVPPTDPADAGKPVWVRRLADSSADRGRSAEVAEPVAAPTADTPPVDGPRPRTRRRS